MHSRGSVAKSMVQYCVFMRQEAEEEDSILFPLLSNCFVVRESRLVEWRVEEGGTGMGWVVLHPLRPSTVA